MSNILAAQSAFQNEISDYANLQKKSAQMHRRSDYGKAESRAWGALATMTALAGVITHAYLTQHLQGADTAEMFNTVISGPVAVGAIAYIAHQAAPFREEISQKLKGMANAVPAIGAGFGNALSGFAKSVGRLGDTLGLSSEARALKAEANHIKGILGVQSMGDVKRIAKNVYGKHNANPVIHDAYWLRTGIDTAVKDKLANGDKTPLSYSDIEMGILKNMEKANVLALSAKESRGQINVMENVVLMVGNANRSNMELKTGDFSKIKDDHSLKMLKERDAQKANSDPSLS